MAGGNEATALLAILLTTAASWLVTTTWLAWAIGSAVPVDSSSMMTGLALVLMVPVGLGQLCHTLGPLARAPVRFKAVLTMVSQLLIFCVIVKAAVDVSQKVGEKTAAVSAGAFVLAGTVSIGSHLAALGIGLGSSRLLGFDRPSQIAVAFSCSQKTLPVALYLFDKYFKEAYPLAVVPIVLYHVGQLVADTFVADALAKGEPTIVNPVALPSTKRSCS
jgi:sodium/bile acid cotransporter 7